MSGAGAARETTGTTRETGLPADFQIFGDGNVRPHRVRHDPTDPAFLTRRTDGRVTFRVLAPPEVADAVVVSRVGDDVEPSPLTRLGAAGVVSLWELHHHPTGAPIHLQPGTPPR